MKMTIAINENVEENEKILDFVACLGLVNTSVDIVYVLERMTALDGILGASDFVENAEGRMYWHRLRDWGLSALQSAQTDLAKKGIASTTKLREGQIANELLDHCKKNSCDLLVLGHTGKGPAESFLMGSVGRKAIIGSTCNVLIVKDSAASSPMKAVFASDHSRYANQAFRRLQYFAPMKFKEATVLTVITQQSRDILQALSGSDALAGGLEKVMEMQNCDLAQDLSGLSKVWHEQVRHGEVYEQIQFCMDETKADLLVMAAQGHGFIDRFLLGSVTMKELFVQNKSILILRNPA